MRVQPIVEIEKIKRIKENLKFRPREYALFIVGIYTHLKPFEILSLKIRDIKNLRTGSYLVLNTGGTAHASKIWVHPEVAKALRQILELQLNHNAIDEDYVFRRADMKPPHARPLETASFTAFVKEWCISVGLKKKNYGTNSLRKTWEYFHQLRGNEPQQIIKAYSRAKQKDTFDYLSFEQEALDNLYKKTNYQSKL